MESIGLKAILEDSNFQAGLKRYQNGIGQMEKSTERAANILQRAGAVMQGAFIAGIGAATLSIGAFVAASKIGLDATLQWSEGLDKMGDMFGISGEKASGFQFLANKVGVSIDEMGVGLNTFTRGLDDMKNAQGGATMTTAKGADAIQSLKERLDDANTRLARAKQNLAEAKKPTDSMRYAVQDAQKAVARLNADLGDATKLVPKAGDKLSPFAEALKKLGVRAYDAKGKLRTFDNLLPEVMDKFEKLPPGINASALAMDLFGARGGSKFLDFLRQGSKGLTEAQKKAKLFGLELSTDEVNAAEEFGFAMNELNLGIKGFWNQIGRQVLPIVRRLVDFLNARIIPVLSKLAKDYMPKIAKVVEDVGQAFGQLIESLAAGDLESGVSGFVSMLLQAIGVSEKFSISVGDALAGVAKSIQDIISAFKTGGLAGGLQEIGNQLGNAFKNIDWTAVSKNLDGLKTRFWEWLTGKGGVLETVGAQIGSVVAAIGGWLSDSENTQPIVDAVLGWVWQFWQWVTDPRAGLLATVFDKMEKLTETMRRWAESATTQKQLQEIGKTVARAVLTGIGRVFENPTGERGDLIGTLVASLGRGAAAQVSALTNIGASIGTGIINGIVSAITGRDMSASFSAWLQKNLKNALILLGGPWAMLANTLFGGTPAPTTTTKPLPWGGTGEKFAEGGPVRRTGMALVHAGEFVLNRQQAMAWAPALASTSTVYNFNHTWPAAVPPSQREWTESMVRRVTQQEVRGILGKG